MQKLNHWKWATNILDLAHNVKQSKQTQQVRLEKKCSKLIKGLVYYKEKEILISVLERTWKKTEIKWKPLAHSFSLTFFLNSVNSQIITF